MVDSCSALYSSDSRHDNYISIMSIKRNTFPVYCLRNQKPVPMILLFPLSKAQASLPFHSLIHSFTIHSLKSEPPMLADSGFLGTHKESPLCSVDWMDRLYSLSRVKRPKWLFAHQPQVVNVIQTSDNEWLDLSRGLSPRYKVSRFKA